MPGTIIVGYTIVDTWTMNIAQMKWLCDLNPLCLGFTTQGFLKSNVTTIVNSVGVDSYIKQ